MSTYDGWTPPIIIKAEPTTKEQLVALRDQCLADGHKEAAAAIDNAIELCGLAAQDPRTPQQKDWDTDAEEITATRRTDEPP